MSTKIARFEKRLEALEDRLAPPVMADRTLATIRKIMNELARVLEYDRSAHGRGLAPYGALARRRMSFTWTGDHCPPRAVAMPRAVRAPATPRKVVIRLA
jgi:hypothetical protein